MAGEIVGSNCEHQCCSPQVWTIADGVPGFPTETPGAVCHRLGVGPMQPKGQSWDYGIGVSIHSPYNSGCIKNMEGKIQQSRILLPSYLVSFMSAFLNIFAFNIDIH